MFSSISKLQVDIPRADTSLPRWHHTELRFVHISEGISKLYINLIMSKVLSK